MFASRIWCMGKESDGASQQRTDHKVSNNQNISMRNLLACEIRYHTTIYLVVRTAAHMSGTGAI